MDNATKEYLKTLESKIAASTGQDARLITQNTESLEAGFNTDYNTYNLNILDENGDALSINNLGNTGKNPSVTLLPDNDWGQASELGKLSYLEDIPTKTSDLTNDNGFIDDTITDISSYITVGSGFTGRIKQAYCWGKLVTIRLLLNRGGTNFVQGRTSSAFSINSAYAPKDQIIHPISASTAVNGYVNRWANLLVTTTGASLIDSYAYSDIKEMEITITYMKG